jgi:hypothetical protein
VYLAIANYTVVTVPLPFYLEEDDPPAKGAILRAALHQPAAATPPACRRDACKNSEVGSLAAANDPGSCLAAHVTLDDARFAGVSEASDSGARKRETMTGYAVLRAVLLCSSIDHAPMLLNDPERHRTP